MRWLLVCQHEHPGRRVGQGPRGSTRSSLPLPVVRRGRPDARKIARVRQRLTATRPADAAVSARHPATGERPGESNASMRSNRGMREFPPGVTHIQDPGGRDALQLEGPGGRVVVALTGAQVLSWYTGRGDVLWTASHPQFQDGKPVRGGVPLVFPWFNRHPTDEQLPAHGFARNTEWKIAAMREGPAIVLATQDNDATRKMWPHAFRLEFAVELSDALRLALTIENKGEEAFRCEQAMHSYWHVGDIQQASVHGLEGVPFTEHASEGEPDWDPAAPLRFRAETDRVFQGTPDDITLQAPKLERTVKLHSENARSTIVWNPWPAKTARLSQMDLDDWQHFCCIETRRDSRLESGIRSLIRAPSDPTRAGQWVAQLRALGARIAHRRSGAVDVHHRATAQPFSDSALLLLAESLSIWLHLANRHGLKDLRRRHGFELGASGNSRTRCRCFMTRGAMLLEFHHSAIIGSLRGSE